MAYPHATIYALGRDGIQEVGYEDIEHYTITRAFLQNPARVLRTLFDDGER